VLCVALRGGGGCARVDLKENFLLTVFVEFDESVSGSLNTRLRTRISIEYLFLLGISLNFVGVNKQIK